MQLELFWSVFSPEQLMKLSGESVQVMGLKQLNAYFYFWVDLLKVAIFPSQPFQKQRD